MQEYRIEVESELMKIFSYFSFHFVLKPVLDLLPAVVLLPGVSVASARGGMPGPVVLRARLVLFPAVLVVVLGKAPDLL